MPIRVPEDLPAAAVLESENIFIMKEQRAHTQQIRPLQILLLNLMPTKITTETQLARLLSNTPLQVELELLRVEHHRPRNTPEEHMLAFYKTFPQVRERNFDGMIITGAPVEQLPFEQVEYWQELCEIFAWSRTHVHSTLHICWAAQAALYYHYGIPKHPLPEKLFGVFRHRVVHRNSILFRGFDDTFLVPHSRQREYLRDKQAGLPIRPPVNYFPNDDDTQPPICTWRSSAHLLYSNWLNYYVYQTTPYDLGQIGTEAPADTPTGATPACADTACPWFSPTQGRCTRTAPDGAPSDTPAQGSAP